MHATGLALGAPIGGSHISPNHTVLPIALKELEHDHLGQGGRIQPNPGENLGRRRHREGQALIDRLNHPITPLLE